MLIVGTLNQDIGVAMKDTIVIIDLTMTTDDKYYILIVYETGITITGYVLKEAVSFKPTISPKYETNVISESR
jgi:hypothetical protein